MLGCTRIASRVVNAAMKISQETRERPSRYVPAAQIDTARAATSGSGTPAQRLSSYLNDSPRMVAQRQMLERVGLRAPVSRGGLPQPLRSGIEALSGLDMSEVSVHHNSDRPAQLNALAYAQGNDIHLGPGQEHHLPHEAWHVVQQRQGRVQPTMQMAGLSVNDSGALESEADVMGRKAASAAVNPARVTSASNAPTGGHAAMQLKRNTKPADGVLLATFANIGSGHTLPGSVLTGKTNDVDKGAAIWAHLQAVYTTNRDRGQRYWDTFQEDIVKYQDIGQKAALVLAKQTTRTGYDTRFRDHYASVTDRLPGAGDEYRINSQGYTGSTAPTVPTGIYGGNYSNEFNVSTGKFKAEYNFAANVDRDTNVVTHYYDKALQGGVGLNNSEILWQQARLAATQHYTGSLTAAADVTAALKNFTQVKRDTVINDETKEAVYMALSDGEQWSTANRSWNSTAEEFKVILGTPNGRSSVHMLKDHLDEVEKTIDTVTAVGGGLEINFAPL